MVDYEVVDKRDDYVRLELRGELAGQPWTKHLRRGLEEHYVDDGVRRILLDVSGVSFCDNFGVAALVTLHRESAEQGKRLFVEGAEGQVQDKLRVTGVLGILSEESNGGG